MSAAARWFPAYIGLGSNLKKPVQQIEDALGLLAEMPETRLVLASSLYRTAPFGGVEQPDFVNAVAAVLTRLTARDLLADESPANSANLTRKRARRVSPRRRAPRPLCTP
mgnify:CR=1 FL=1